MESTVTARRSSVTRRAYYSPPWANTSIIGIAGSSGSGKTSLAMAIVKALSLPWVVVLSMDSYYKSLNAEQSAAAFRNEYDFDSPDAIDFDALLANLKDLKAGRRAEIPIYSFEKHNREAEVHNIYSPHVLILEGIFALHDERVRNLLDLMIFADADGDLCLSRRLVRDVKSRGRDIEGCIKQWFAFVKPNFHKYVEPQRIVADLIVPRGIENTVAIGMITDRVRKSLHEKSKQHQQDLKRLGQIASNTPLGKNSIVLTPTSQIVGMNTLLLDPVTDREDFIFYFDRMATLLIERAAGLQQYKPKEIVTATPRASCMGLSAVGSVSAVVILRGGSIMEPALRRVVPDCRTGRILIQTNVRTGEPELHYQKIHNTADESSLVLLLDAQMSSGGAALMAVKVLVDHGIPEDKIVFCCYMAGKNGIARVLSVFPDVRVVVGRLVGEVEERWVETKYLGC